MYKKILFWVILIGLLSLVPVTILSNTTLAAGLMYSTSTSNLIQRFLGLILFILLFWQIMFGAYMGRWKERTEVAIYFLVLMHPLMYLAFRHFAGAGTDPIFVYLGLCLFCQTKLDFYYTLGRIAFWLLTVGIFASLFRASTPFLKKNWKNFNALNYVAFLIAGIHGFLLGTDFMTPPFYYFAIIAYLLVIFTIIHKLPGLLLDYKTWLNS